MFAFFGKLMGIAIRSKEYLSLCLPPLVWKLLVRDAVGVEELEGVDRSLVKNLEMIGECEIIVCK